MKTELSIASGPAATEGGNDVASSADTPRWRSALRSFLAFTGAWVLSGFAFNAGPVALVGAAMLFVAVGLVEARRHFGLGPVRTSRRALGTIAAAALFAASFGLFFLAEVSRWERSSPGYVSSPQEPEALLQVGEDAARDLVARLGGSAQQGETLATFHESSDVID